MLLINFIVIAALLPQLATPLIHCKLIRAEATWQGECAELSGEKPNLSLSAANSIKSGRYQKAEPTAIYAGEMRISDRVVPIEIEAYPGGTGILRPEGSNWLVIANLVNGSDALEFDLDLGKTVPPSDLDRDIIIRAAAILRSESAWDRADDRQCHGEDKTWSIYCSLIRATSEITGGSHHRRPAMQVVREIVSERSAGRSYQHRLRDYNNDPSTTPADVHSLFEEALARLKR